MGGKLPHDESSKTTFARDYLSSTAGVAHFINADLAVSREKMLKGVSCGDGGTLHWCTAYWQMLGRGRPENCRYILT